MQDSAGNPGLRRNHEADELNQLGQRDNDGQAACQRDVRRECAAETNPYCARSWLVICVTAAHVLGSGRRNTPKRNWLSPSVRPSIPHDTVGPQRRYLAPRNQAGHRNGKKLADAQVADLADGPRDSEESGLD